MKTMQRLAVLAFGMAAAVVVPAAPASAVTTIEFTGTAFIGCFGCGTYGPGGNGATIWATGIFHNQPVVAQQGVTANNGYANFVVGTPPGGVNCLLGGNAAGHAVIAGIGTDFNWARLGAIAVINTLDGDYGAAVFVVTSPVGIPCGGPVVAQFAGTLAGLA